MTSQPTHSENEMALRLADVQAIVANAKRDELGDLHPDDTSGFLSALDYALRGSPGCIEPDEWQRRREENLAEHGDYLGLEKVR